MTNIIACCLYYLAFQFVKEHVNKDSFNDHSRTCRDITLSKNTFEILNQKYSYLIWWSYAGSNRGPPACKAGALPAEL